MAKNVLSHLLISLLLFCSSCTVSPTYSRNEITDVVQQMCKEEFDMDVHAWDMGKTLWIYAPVDNILTEENKVDPDALTAIRRVFLSLRRVILSMNTPPDFYVFVVSEVKGKGMDIYYMGFVPDVVKLQLGMISISQYQEREVFFEIPNEEALGDLTGEHIAKFDITMGEFISYLIRQYILRAFVTQDIIDYIEINELETYYYNGKLGVTFDIQIKSDKPLPLDLKIPNPFDTAVAAVKKFLKIYKFDKVYEIEINDTFLNKKRSYSKAALFDKE